MCSIGAMLSAGAYCAHYDSYATCSAVFTNVDVICLLEILCSKQMKVNDYVI